MSTTTLVTDRAADIFGEATATFSPCRTYRYALTRRWYDNVEGVAFVMLNPSTADAFQVDPTIRRCLRFARSWGFGALLVLNLFALRSTDPAALKTHVDPVGPDNDAVIAEWAERLHSRTVVGAWGVHGAYRDRDRRAVDMLREHGLRVMCLGTTKGGHPRHPLYVPGDGQMVKYRAVSR